jgi:hypothetical protein
VDIISLPEDEQNEIRKEMRILMILWTAILAQSMVFVFMREVFGEQIRKNVNVADDYPLGILTAVMLVVSMILMVVAFFLRGALLSGKLISIQERAEQVAEASGRPVYLVKYRILIWIPMILPSAPSVFAFVLFFLGADATVFYTLIVLSVLGVLYHRPKMEELLEFREKEQQAGLE